MPNLDPAYLGLQPRSKRERTTWIYADPRGPLAVHAYEYEILLVGDHTNRFPILEERNGQVQGHGRPRAVDVRDRPSADVAAKTDD